MYIYIYSVYFLFFVFLLLFLLQPNGILHCKLPENQIPHGFPTIDMGPQLKVVERTRTATMLCAASGNPDPEISWFKDMLPVEISNSNPRIKQLRSGESSFNLIELNSECCRILSLTFNPTNRLYFMLDLKMFF